MLQPENAVRGYLQLTEFGRQQKVGLLLDAQRKTDVTRRNEQRDITSLYRCYIVQPVEVQRSVATMEIPQP
jgi:hypothetical protein